MWIADGWKDYELLDCSDGEKLERWGKYILCRPDPQAIWKTPRRHSGWGNQDARYSRSNKGGGGWSHHALPAQWKVSYGDLTFHVKPMNFKHTGLFPEQAANWDFMRREITAAGRPLQVLNLFAYTGGATVAAAKAGATVCHVDAAKGMVQRAKDNAALSGLADAPVRYIVDDVRKFLLREKRRESYYDAIIMDPPSYGRGTGGEVWKLEDNLEELIELCTEVLTEKPLFFLLNSYSTGLSPLTMRHTLELALKRGGYAPEKVEEGELALPCRDGSFLPCGGSVRVTF